MSPQQFQSATLAELESKTGIHASRWSRYFNSRIAMTERTLARAADCLDMDKIHLLQALNERRRRTRELLAARLEEKTIA